MEGLFTWNIVSFKTRWYNQKLFLLSSDFVWQVIWNLSCVLRIELCTLLQVQMTCQLISNHQCLDVNSREPPTILCFFSTIYCVRLWGYFHMITVLIVYACRIPITKGKLNMGTWQVFNFSIWHYALLLSHAFPCFLSFMVVGLIVNGSLFLSIVPLFSVYILHCSRLELVISC